MDGKRPTVSSRHGIVAAAHPLAASAGAKMLARGGKGADATAALSAVKDPKSAEIAGLWKLYVDTQATPAPAAAAPAN